MKFDNIENELNDIGKQIKDICRNSVCTLCSLYCVEYRGEKRCVVNALKESVANIEIKTRAQWYKELYPNERTDENGYPLVPPCQFDFIENIENCDGECTRCRVNYWAERVKRNGNIS